MAQDDIQAVAPDGSTHVFPANTSDDVIDRTMKSYISSSAPITPQSMMARSQQQARTEGQRPLVQAVQQRGVQDQQSQALDQSLNKPSGLENTVSQVKKGNYPGAIHAAASGLASAYSPLMAPALMTAPIPALAGLAGSAVGQFVGKEGAEALGASPDWQDVAGDVGAVAGSVGGYKGGELLPQTRNELAAATRSPATAGQAALGKPGSPKYAIPFLKSAEDFFLPKGDVGTLTHPSDQALPPRMASDLVNNIRMQNLGIGEMPQTPQGPWSPDPKFNLPDVNVIPEPRSPFNEEVPNYMASVKRKELLGLAKTGKPGAGLQIQQLGKKVIYAPPSGFNPPRSVTSFDEDPYSPTR